MKKITLKQMNPDFINWDINWDNYVMENDGINDFIVGGNRDFKTLEKLSDNLLSYVFNNFNSLTYYQVDDYIVDDLYTILKYRVSKKRIKEVLNNEAQSGKSDLYVMFDILNALKPNKYVMETIRGYSQSDWAYILTTKENEKNIDYIEAHYFGMYNEYELIEQENGEDDYILDILLTHNEAWKHEKDMKKYIKNIYGYDIDEFMEFKGYEKIESYETITY